MIYRRKIAFFIASIRQYKEKISAVLVGQFLAGLGAFAGVRLLTEFISPEVYGGYKLLFSGISLGIGILVSPLMFFAAREYHDAEQAGEVNAFLNQMRKLLVKYISLVLLVCAFVVVFLFPSESFGFWAGTGALIIIGIRTLIEFERTILTTKNQQTTASIIAVAEAWLVPFLMLVLVLIFSESVLLMVGGTIAAMVIVYGLISYKAGKRPDSVGRPTEHFREISLFKRALNYGWPIAAASALSWGVNECDRFFLVYYHDDRAVGIYTAAYGLVAGPFVMLSGAVARFAFPYVFAGFASRGASSKSLSRMLFANGVICIIGVVIVTLFKDTIATVGLGELYREPATELMVLIAIGYGCWALASSFDIQAFANKKTMDMIIAYGVAAVVNVVFNVILIPDLATLGAAIATMIAMACYLGAMALMYRYRQSVRRIGSENI